MFSSLLFQDVFPFHKPNLLDHSKNILKGFHCTSSLDLIHNYQMPPSSTTNSCHCATNTAKNTDLLHFQNWIQYLLLLSHSAMPHTVLLHKSKWFLHKFTGNKLNLYPST